VHLTVYSITFKRCTFLILDGHVRHQFHRVFFTSFLGAPSRMFWLASSSAAHIAAPTVFVNDRTSPMIGIRLSARVAAPNLATEWAIRKTVSARTGQHVRCVFRSEL
jgi:hypothetical protein